MNFTFAAVSEDRPGLKWQRLYRRFWPAYQRWFLSEGIMERPKAAIARRKIRDHMPDIVPLYDRLVELAGGSDLAARFLSLYRPPAYLAGCSQVAWNDGEPVLIRNYDFMPRLCEGVIFHGKWLGRPVIHVNDCLWGALDGMNNAGLAASITFGGRRVVGDGFGIPIVLRYVLEAFDRVSDAVAFLATTPLHMAYNVTLVDKWGSVATVLMSPDRKAEILELNVATNHQGNIDWHDYARATATVERERFLQIELTRPGMNADLLAEKFLSAPLYSYSYAQGYGTIYTSIYRPWRGEVEFRWPGQSWLQSFEKFSEGEKLVQYRIQGETSYPSNIPQAAAISF